VTRILVVEDDPDIAQLVAHYLEKSGFSVDRLANGRDALVSIAAHAPDVLVLDLMLPQVDGLEICRVVRGNEATAGIPIIMLTARAEESDRIVGLEIGADDYLAKPFSPNELVARVRALVRRAQRAGPAGAVTGKPTNYGSIAVDPERHTITDAGETVTLTALPFGQTTKQVIATLQTTANGAFSFSVTPQVNTTYQAQWKGSESSVAVQVQPLIKLPFVSHSGWFHFYVTSGQSFAGRSVYLQRFTLLHTWINVRKLQLGQQF